MVLRSLIIVLTFVCTLATSQSSLLKVDTLWIHKANSNEEDMDSYFPILNSSAKPVIAHNLFCFLPWLQYLRGKLLPLEIFFACIIHCYLLASGAEG